MNRGDLQQLIRFVEQKTGLGNSQVWTNGDFEKLSAQVRRETKEYISTATLKRIFGKVPVSEGYTPHRSTIEVLERFVQYEERLQAEASRQKAQRKIIRYVGLGLGIVLLLSIVIWTWQSSRKFGATPPNGTLVLESQEGGCPATAYFNLELDSLAGYQLWFGDESPSVWLPTKHTLSHAHFYAFPGYFFPKLTFNQQTVSHSRPVLVETDGWKAFAYLFKSQEKQKRYYPLPFGEQIVDSGIFFASKAHLSQVGLDTTQILVVRLDHYSKKGVSGGHFVYETRVKNDEFWPGVRCYAMTIRVQGTGGKLEFKLVAEGCSGYSQVVLGDSNVVDKNQLRPLAIDVTTWNTLRIEHHQGKVTLTRNGQVLLEGAVNQAIGELLGTSLIFHGSGKADYVRLTVEGNEILQTPF